MKIMASLIVFYHRHAEFSQKNIITDHFLETYTPLLNHQRYIFLPMMIFQSVFIDKIPEKLENE